MHHLRNSLLLLVIGSLLWISMWRLATPHSVIFSDAVKFAESAQNLLNGQGRQIRHSFFNSYSLEHFQPNRLFSPGFLPVISFAFMPFIKFFGANDLAIALTSGFFYLASILMIYCLGNRFFNQNTGFLAALVFSLHPQILDLSTSGASEILFTALILLAFICLTSSNKFVQLLSLPLMVAFFFTRHQAFIFIGFFALFWVISHFSGKKKYFAIASLIIFTYFTTQILHHLSNLDPNTWYSPLSSVGNIVYNSPLYPNNDALRAPIVLAENALIQNLIPLVGKVFYNSYNFLKTYWLLATPAFSTFFLLALFLPLQEKKQKNFRLLTGLLVVASYLAASITIPNFRYILPVLPFVAIMVAYFLLTIAQHLRLSNRLTILLCCLVLFVSTSETWGHIWIDYRFRQKNYNLNQPTINFCLSQKISQHALPGQLIITNLDAWASWYFGLTTMWFPLEPAQLITPSPKGPQLGPVSYIYLTEYKIDEGDFYMGQSWRQALYHPDKLSPRDPVFSHFKVVEKFTVEPTTNYENLRISGVIYKRID